MKQRIFKLSVLLALVVALVASMALSASAEKTVDIMQGLSITDSTGNGSYTNGVYTATAKGSMISKKTNTITITNNGSETVKLSFDYSVTSASAFTIDGASDSASGSYERLWNSGETVTIVITSNSGFSNLTVTLTLKNIAIEEVAAGANVTFNYDSSLGSVTVDGEEVTTETVVAVASSGANLVATGKNGGTFLGWVNANNEVFSTASQYTLKTAEDLTIKAIFVGANSAPHFAVSGGTQQSASYGLFGLGSFNYYNANKPAYIFDNFNTAVETAASTTSKYVVLLNDATLPAGDYTVPAGVTLVVPFNKDNSVYTTNSLHTTTETYSNKEEYVQPTAYRTLTMASGSKLEINGALSLPARHRYANGNQVNGGSPVGDVSFINMQAGSTIQINNGGALYAYGYITGNGNVIAYNGAKVYELFQIMDFRGGDQTTQMENGVFPLSQYYVQNIEVPMTLHYGATEHSYTTVYMQKSYMATSVAFIGPKNAMFNLTSGSVTKQYDGSNDRLVVEVNGNMDISPISMDFGLSDIDSSDYVLPVNGNISITVKNGSQLTIKQDVAMLPGSELIIEEGAFATLSNGCNAYFYDAAEWGNYCGASNKTFIPLTYAPSRTYTRTAADLKDAVVIVNGTVDASLAAAYTTASGASIYSTGNGKVSLALGAETITYQLVQGTGYTEIPIVPVKLKNADGTHLETGKGSKENAATYTYNAELGKWLCEEHTYGEGVVTAPTCESDGYTTYTCSVCQYSYIDDVIMAQGHTVAIDPAVNPDCTNTGLTDGSHCSVCNKVLVAQEEILALGHSEETDAAVAATCTENGLTEGKHCAACGKVTVAQEEVPALGHNEVIDAAVVADCENTGLTEGKHCDRCGEVCIAQEVVPALGHNEVIDAAVAPECNNPGMSEGAHCDRCGKVFVAQEEIPAQGHNEVIDEGKVATCTETGLTEGKHCDRCGEVFVAQKEIPSLGHSHGDWEVTKNPTYTETGSQSKTCSVCGDVVTEEIPVLANPVNSWNICLGDDIGVNFNLNVSNDDEVDVTINGVPADFKINDGLMTVHLAAAQMTDKIVITINGMPVTNTYTVRGYAETILNSNETEQTKALVRAMLVYGGAAQKYFKYNLGNLADNGYENNAVVSTEVNNIVSKDDIDGLSFYGASLIYRNKNAVRFYFAGNTIGMTFTANGEKVTTGTKNEMSYIEVANINPQNLGDAIEVVVTAEDGKTLTVAYSPLNYIVRMYTKAGSSEETKLLAQAMYGYYQAALAYMSKN